MAKNNSAKVEKKKPTSFPTLPTAGLESLAGLRPLPGGAVDTGPHSLPSPPPHPPANCVELTPRRRSGVPHTLLSTRRTLHRFLHAMPLYLHARLTGLRSGSDALEGRSGQALPAKHAGLCSLQERCKGEEAASAAKTDLARISSKF